VATQPDPYATLGLPPGASTDEIRRAYRRLAKANHPDSAGEKALPRFLAIQAAYESLVGASGTHRPGARPAGPQPTAREGWRANPERARATRQGPTARPAGPAGSAGPDGPAAGRRRRPAGDEPRRPAGGRKRASNTATPGSTTYDTAEDEPFEPEWSGGTWYGATSGTYWTLNPKEYADPRKHGPEYQRRARRRTGEPAPPPPDATDGVDGGPTTEAWTGWQDQDPGTAPDEPAGGGGPSPTDGVAGTTGVAAGGGFLGLHGFPARVGLALVGWPAIGIAITTVAGEVTGCGRFAAGCVELFGVGTWLAQVAVLAILLVLPSIALLSAVGTLAALAASVPTAVILSASGGSREPAVSAAILGGVLAIAYAAGVAFALVRRTVLGRVP
jgi:DnaJ domain